MSAVWIAASCWRVPSSSVTRDGCVTPTGMSRGRPILAVFRNVSMSAQLSAAGPCDAAGCERIAATFRETRTAAPAPNARGEARISAPCRRYPVGDDCLRCLVPGWTRERHDAVVGQRRFEEPPARGHGDHVLPSVLPAIGARRRIGGPSELERPQLFPGFRIERATPGSVG